MLTMMKLKTRILIAGLLLVAGMASANNKPVKVYILSGQSNMVGFGRLKDAPPAYPSIFLSADPSIRPARMPVGNSALLPHLVFQHAQGDARGAKASIYAGAYDPETNYAKQKPVKETVVELGNVTEMLPSIRCPHTVVVHAFIEVPISGYHEVYAGFGESTHAVVSIAGKEVYRRDPGGERIIQKMMLEKERRYPVTITYMQGGSAAFWMELVDIKGKGDLEWFINTSGLFQDIMDANGEWTILDDVILNDAYLGKGRSTPLSATANGRFFGPELGFGFMMGKFHDEPVLLIKSAIGNRSLGWDFLPPGSERFEATVTTRDGEEKTFIYAGYKDPQERWEKGTEPKAGGWYAGKQYDDCTEAIRAVLDNFDTHYPQFADRGYEIAGFVWWQGHKDQNPVHAGRYELNLVNLINAWRKEFNAPDAKWAIATIAFGGWTLAEPGLTIANAQLAVSGETGNYPEFAGNVRTIEARGFWRESGESPTATGFHYNHNAATYLLVGDALARAMVEMMGGTVEPLPPGIDRPPVEPKPDPENPTLADTVEMIYRSTFISPWARDPAEPSKEQMTAMSMALRPMILDKMVPLFPETSARVPRHLRRGFYLAPIITGKRTGNIGGDLTSDLDTLFRFYRAAGIHDYGWKPFGPDMQNATWSYFTFDPPEEQDKAQDNRYRDVTYPTGMENWFAADFDAAKAGWQTGAAPFGQKDGRLEALHAGCKNPHCGCGITPRTLWDKEVLLMRQTFEIPKLEPNHRYRLVVGGSSHNYAGEGFALYVNGKLFAESKTGYYKQSAEARGGFVFDDFLPEFESGKVTIAVKSFLRHTNWSRQIAPARGHLSVWMETARIPEVILDAFKND